MTFSDKLTGLRLGQIEFNHVPLDEALAYLRQAAHDADQDIDAPLDRWGVPVGHLLHPAAARAVRVNVYLEDTPLLEALLWTAEAVGCALHVNSTGCYVVPPAFRPWLPTVGRDEQGRAVLPTLPFEPVIPGIPPDPAADFAGTEATDTIQRAFEQVLPAFEFNALSVEAAVEVLSSLAPGIPTVVCNPAGDTLPGVTLSRPEGATFGEVLANVAEAAGMEVLYQRTGIVLCLPGTVAIHPPGAETA